MKTMKQSIMDLMKMGLSKQDILKHMSTLNQSAGIDEIKLVSLYNQCVFEYCKTYGYNTRSMSVQREPVM